jgi:hypothetical protein
VKDELNSRRRVNSTVRRFDWNWSSLTMHTPSLCLLLISFVSPVAGRENPLFDAYYTKIGFAAENARLNNYAIQLKMRRRAEALSSCMLKMREL